MPDNLTPAQRSYCMSRVRTRDTDLERRVARAFRARHLSFQRQADDLPGRPDIVFREERVAIFVDGDFWHGFRFPLWRAGLSEFWQAKIARNRLRDRRNFAALRRAGWRVVRIWQHQVGDDLAACVERVVAALASRSEGGRRGRRQARPRHSSVR